MPTDVEKLQGEWRLVKAVVGGAPLAANALAGAGMVLDGNRFESIGMGGEYTGTFAVDPKRTPRGLSIEIGSGHAAGTRNVGIYRMSGDRWTICIAASGNRRPSKFESRPGSEVALQTFVRGAIDHRAAVAAMAAPPIASATVVRGTGPATVLEGEWAMVSAVLNGAPLAEGMVSWCKRVTRGNVTSVLAGPKVMLRASFALDESTKPWSIEYMNLEGADKGKAQRGIVELRGSVLRICMSAPGAARPTEFASAPGDKRSLTVWRFP